MIEPIKAPRLKTACQDCGMELDSWKQKHDIVDCIEYRFLTKAQVYGKDQTVPYAEIGAIKILVGYVRRFEADEAAVERVRD